MLDKEIKKEKPVPVKPEIPKEFLVVIDGQEFDNRDRYIKKDYFTNQWIHLGNLRGDYVEIKVPIKFDGIRIISETVFSKIYPNDTVYAEFQYDLENYNLYTRLSFKNQNELDAFCKLHDFIKGVNNPRFYYHKTMLKYDRSKPYHFDFTKRKLDVFNYLQGGIYIDEKLKLTKEYKDLLAKVYAENEKNGTESKTFRSFEGINLTYGIELETSSGVFKTDQDLNILKDFNFQSVHDGSLRDADGSGPWSGEYVSGVLKGDSGLKQIHDFLEFINKRCQVDKRTAAHVHIGSLNWNSEDIVFAYILGKMIEKEIFSIMPKSRSNNEYCKELPDLNANKVFNLTKKLNRDNYKKLIKTLYNSVFNIVGKQGAPNKTYNKKSQHPQGRHGGYERQRDHRYSWLNFTNIIFNQRGSLDSKTIEYRVHPGTLSYKKVHNWIKVCMAITEFVNVGKKDIIKAISESRNITLTEILIKIYPKSHCRLIEYIELRKDLFCSDCNEDVDYVIEPSTIKNIKELVCV